MFLVGLAGCGGDRFDRDAALEVVGDETVVDAAEEVCALDDDAYRYAVAIAIDDDQTALVEALEAGCPKQP